MPDTLPRSPSLLKPVRLAASATRTLPRWGLVLLCLLYILPGLFGRDPWKNIDAANFGVMWTMAEGTFNDWLYPNIAGVSMPRHGPLTFWAGAACIKIFGWLTGAVSATRIATLLFFRSGRLLGLADGLFAWATHRSTTHAPGLWRTS